MNDQNTEPVPPLVAAAAAIDDKLPAAWSRVAEYLVAYGDPTGTLGKRKAADDRTAVLDAGDLHTILNALETAIDAGLGPEPTGPGGAVFHAYDDIRKAAEKAVIDVLARIAPAELENEGGLAAPSYVVQFDGGKFTDETAARIHRALSRPTAEEQ